MDKSEIMEELDEEILEEDEETEQNDCNKSFISDMSQSLKSKRQRIDIVSDEDDEWH